MAAGAGNIEVINALVPELVAGVTPATPAFKKSPFQINISSIPRVTEQKSKFSRGQRSGVTRSGFTTTGQITGEFIPDEIDDWLASLLQGSWVSDVLVNGQGRSTFTVEDAVPQGEGAAAMNYTRYRGVEAVGGSISLTAGDPSSISFDLLGSGSDDATATPIVGATYADPLKTNGLGSGSDIGLITMSGFGTLGCMSEATIDFTYDGRQEQLRLSNDDPCGISRGAFLPVVTGKFYVQDKFIELYNAARNGTEFALSIPIGQTTGEKYTFEFPRAQFVESPSEFGEGGPAFQAFKIMPIFDSVADGTIKITRKIT
jgi:hypothetical protein